MGLFCRLLPAVVKAARLADRSLRLAREGKEGGYEAWTPRLLGEIASRRDPQACGPG